MAASSTQQDQINLFELVRKYSQSTASITNKDDKSMFKLAACCKDFLQQKASTLLLNALNMPVLCSYSSDGTPIRTNMSIRVQHGNTTTSRSGKATKEYLLQLAFYRTLDMSGAAKTVVVMKGPLPLTEGKSANAQFVSGRDFFKTLREQGHEGIAIQHYTFDRAGYKALLRLFSQQHAMLAPSFGYDTPGGSGFLDKQEWVVGTACALHDAHNTLKWSLRSHISDLQLMKDIYIGIRSLREAYNYIVEHLCPWLLKSVAFTDPAYLPDDEVLRASWACLHTDPVLIEILVDLKLTWDPEAGLLRVATKWAKSPELMETLSDALLCLWEFKAFSESRWITVGSSTRTLVAGLLTGLKALVAYIRFETSASDYHIHGFARLEKPAATKFLVTASLVSFVPDGALQEIMEDSRVAMRYAEIKDALFDELDWLQGIGLPVWDRLASVCGDTGFSLRSAVLSCGHKAAAFFDYRVLSKINKLPWSLAMGDQDSNINELISGPPPTELVANKIYKLAKFGYNRKKLKLGLDLLLDCNWATGATEQAHGMAATVKKFHSELHAEMLIARAMVSGVNRLLPSLSSEEKQELKLLASLESQNQKNPNCITGRQVYFQELVKASNTLSKQGRMSMPYHVSKIIMKQHGGRYAKLAEDKKKELEYKASLIRSQSSDTQMEDRLHTVARLDLLQHRMLEEEEDRPPMTFKAAKLEEEDEAALSALWNSNLYSHANNKRKSIAGLTAPQLLDDDQLRKLNDHPVWDPDAENDHPPAWVGSIAKWRHLFKNTALLIVTGPDASWFLFQFAMQSPQHVCWSAISLSADLDESAGSASEAVQNPLRVFTVEPRSFKSWQQLPVSSTSQLYVLPDLQFCGDYLCQSDRTLFELKEFIDDNMPIVEPPKKSGSRMTCQ